MNADLEMTLDELGPDYRSLVGRLRAAYASPVPMPAGVRAATASGSARLGWRRAAWGALPTLAAASLAFCVGWLVHCPDRTATERSVVAAAPQSPDAAHEYRLALLRNDEAVREIIRTQGADGGWKTAFLTRQNAEALRLCQTESARVAYKRALRNLRARGY